MVPLLHDVAQDGDLKEEPFEKVDGAWRLRAMKEYEAVNHRQKQDSVRNDELSFVRLFRVDERKPVQEGEDGDDQEGTGNHSRGSMEGMLIDRVTAPMS